MLKNHNDSYFRNHNVSEIGYIFFLQRWLELLESKTIDTYQYSIINTLSGLNELIMIIDKTLDGSFTTNSNVKAIKEELIRCINEDIILEKYFRNMKKQILFNLGESLSDKEGKRAELLRLKNEVKYSLVILEYEYYEKLISELYLSINKCDYMKIDKLSRILASYAVNIGWTSKGLSAITRNIFLMKPDRTSEQKWNEFIEKFTKKDKYYIYITIAIDSVNEKDTSSLYFELERIGLVVCHSKDIYEKHLSIERGKIPIKTEKRYIVFKEEASDIYSATRNAIEQLNKKITV